MTAKCFVDTNVLVYARDPRAPAKQAAAIRWLTSLKASDMAVISFQVIHEYYHVMTRKFSPGLPTEAARADVRNFLEWEPVPPTPALYVAAWQVQDKYGLAWWDCLVVAAAQMDGCRYLLSEDFSAGHDYGGVRVINPFATEPADVLG